MTPEENEARGARIETQRVPAATVRENGMEQDSRKSVNANGTVRQVKSRI